MQYVLSICKFTLSLLWMEQACCREKCSLSFFLFAQTLLQKRGRGVEVVIKEIFVARRVPTISMSWTIYIPCIISKIREGTICWLGHVERMPEERIVKKVLKNIPEGKMSIWKPSKRWLDSVKYDLKKMGVRAWKLTLKEARVLPRPQSQWRENKIQWNLSKLTTDRSWNSGQHKQVVNLHRCVPK